MRILCIFESFSSFSNTGAIDFESARLFHYFFALLFAAFFLLFLFLFFFQWFAA